MTMPATAKAVETRVESDGERPNSMAGRIEKKPRATALPPGRSGYGYEIAVLAAADARWPLEIVQWAVRAELVKDLDLLSRVRRFDGLTVGDVHVGQGRSVNILIAPARKPLPPGTRLPSGQMDLLIATTITAEEVAWSMKNGRGALLEKLMGSSVGQVSSLDRKSVVR